MERSRPQVLYVEYDRPNRHLHFWVGPAGVHFALPDVHKSRLGWCRAWREPPEALTDA